MSPPIPTTKELEVGIVASISSKINQVIAQLFKSFVIVLAKTLSGVLIVLYKYAGFIFLQEFVATASFAEITVLGRKIKPLVFWGRLIGVGDPLAATNSELEIDISVITQGGELIAGETQLIGSLNGFTYTLQNNLDLDAPIVQGFFKAAADPFGGGGAGASGNLSAGDVLSFATPYGDVEQDAEVADRIVDGADGESQEAYREKIEDRFGGRPQGGAGLDYVYWALEEAGIINVYSYTGSPGEVDVYSEATPASSGNPDGIPTAAQLEAVYDLIQLDQGGLALRRPLNAFVNSLPITRNGYTIDITDLTGEDLPTLKNNIEEAFDVYFFGREPYIDGVTPLPKKQNITLDDARAVVNDFASAANGSFSSVVIKFTVSGLAFDVYTLTEGEKSKLTIVNYLTS